MDLNSLNNFHGQIKNLGPLQFSEEKVATQDVTVMIGENNEEITYTITIRGAATQEIAEKEIQRIGERYVAAMAVLYGVGETSTKKIRITGNTVTQIKEEKEVDHSDLDKIRNIFNERKDQLVNKLSNEQHQRIEQWSRKGQLYWAALDIANLRESFKVAKTEEGDAGGAEVEDEPVEEESKDSGPLPAPVDDDITVEVSETSRRRAHGPAMSEEFRKKADILENAIRERARRREQLDAELQQTREKNAVTESDLQNAQKLKERLKKFKEENARLERLITELENRLRTERQERSAPAVLKEPDEENRKLAKELNDLKENFHNQSENLRNALAARDSLIGDLEERDNEIRNIKEELERQKDKNNRLEDENASLKELTKRNQASIKALQQEADRSKARANEADLKAALEEKRKRAKVRMKKEAPAPKPAPLTTKTARRTPVGAPADNQKKIEAENNRIKAIRERTAKEIETLEDVINALIGALKRSVREGRSINETIPKEVLRLRKDIGPILNQKFVDIARNNVRDGVRILTIRDITVMETDLIGKKNELELVGSGMTFLSGPQLKKEIKELEEQINMLRPQTESGAFIDTYKTGNKPQKIAAINDLEEAKKILIELKIEQIRREIKDKKVFLEHKENYSKAILEGLGVKQ